MTRADALASAYLAARPRLIRIAYAVLGSLAEAEDVVSDAWLRLAAADEAEPVRDVEAWATVAVSRGALDTYRSARRRREEYVGPWLPEPLVEPMESVAGVSMPGADGSTGDPADRITLDDSVSFAFLVVLESLSPAERTAWVLHDLFGLPFGEVAEVVGRSPQAVRQLASRARNHLQDKSPRLTVDPGEHSSVVGSFLTAAGGGDIGALVSLLDPDVVLTSDGGGVVNAARRPVLGPDNVARFVIGIGGQVGADEEVRVVAVNGGLGIAVFAGERITNVMSLTVVDGLVTRVDIVRAPDKLRGWSRI